MKKSLQYLIVLIAVLGAHLGIAAALIKAAKAPEPAATAETEPTVAAPAAVPAPEPKEAPPAAAGRKEPDPAATADKPAPGPVIDDATPAGPPLPPETESMEKESPAEDPISTGRVGPPLPPERSGDDPPAEPGAELVPEERSILKEILDAAGPTENTEAATPPVGPDLTEPSPDSSAAPAEPSAPATPAEESPTPPLAETIPAPDGESAAAAPAIKKIREFKRSDGENPRTKIEETVKKDLPSAVEAFAPDTTNQNDIDAVIRQAQSNLRRRVNESKASLPPVGGGNSAPPVSAGPPAPAGATLN